MHWNKKKISCFLRSIFNLKSMKLKNNRAKLNTNWLEHYCYDFFLSLSIYFKPINMWTSFWYCLLLENSQRILTDVTFLFSNHRHVFLALIEFFVGLSLALAFAIKKSLWKWHFAHKTYFSYPQTLRLWMRIEKWIRVRFQEKRKKELKCFPIKSPNPRCWKNEIKAFRVVFWNQCN